MAQWSCSWFGSWQVYPWKRVEASFMKIYSQIVLGGCKTKHHWIICSRRLWGAFWFSNTNYLPLILYILDTQMIVCSGEDHPVLNQHPATPLQHRCFRGLYVKQTSDIWPFWGIYLLSATITYTTSYFWGLHAISNIQLWKRQGWPQMKTMPGTGVSGKVGQFTKRTSSVARMWPPSLDTW